MYYKEEIVKNTPYRENYRETLGEFIENARSLAESDRENFISPEKYKQNPDFFRKEFTESLGFPLCGFSGGSAGLKEKTFVAKDLNVNIYRLVFDVSGVQVYALFFEQEKSKETAPFILCYHGGQGTPEIVSSFHLDSGNYNHLARRLTDEGANVLCPQTLLWNKELYDDGEGVSAPEQRKDFDSKLRQLGGSITAAEIYFSKKMLDFFVESGVANANKLGTAGLSYGGMYSLYYAAFDERIKACYSSSFYNDQFVYSWTDWSRHNAERRFNNAEIAGIVAPRFLAVSVGDKDELFSPDTAKEQSERTKEFFKAFGVENNFYFEIFNGFHETNSDGVCIKMLVENLNK